MVFRMHLLADTAYHQASSVASTWTWNRKLKILYKMCQRLFRAWSRSRRQVVQQWETDHVVIYDKARAGSSAFKAAAARALQLEIAQAVGKCAAALLWDVHKYFDSVNIAELSSRAQKASYPVLDLAMGLQMHVSPRVLQHQKHCSQPTRVTQSILAGCSQAVPFTKAFLNHELGLLQETGVSLGVYIDDVGLSTSGSVAEVIQHLAAAGVKFVRCMQAAKLKVAAKSVLLATSKAAANHIIAKLARAGIHVDKAKCGRDLSSR